MKTACQTLVMIACAVLIHGTSYALSPNPAPQEQSSVSSTTYPGNNRPTDASSAENGKRQKIGTHSDGQRTRRHISDNNHTRSRVSLSKANRLRQLRNGRAGSTPKDAINVPQPSSSKPAGAAGAARIVNRRTPLVRPAGNAALGGQQFRNANNRAPRMANISGPVKPARNTAAINGTSMNRRHVN